MLFIGAGTVIVGKTQLSNNVIVAANSVVTKDTLDDCYALGATTEMKG